MTTSEIDRERRRRAPEYSQDSAAQTHAQTVVRLPLRDAEGPDPAGPREPPEPPQAA